MPDFLSASSEPTPMTPAPSAPPSAPPVSEPPETKAKTPAPAPKTPKPAPPSKRRTHSKIFTHYYGAFFVLIIGLFLGAGYLLCADLYASIARIEGETRMTLDTLESERAYLDALNRSIASAESIPAEVLARVNETLPNDSGIPKLLVTMAEIARQSGVEIGGLQFSPSGAAASDSKLKLALAPVAISTTVRAPGYQTMRRYLTNLEESLRLIDVDSINVSTGGDDDEFTYALQLTAYSVTEAVRQERTVTPNSEDELMAPTLSP